MKMTYEEFKAIVDKTAERSYIYGYRAGKENEEECRVNWVSGGRSGGSCWDEGESSYYSVSAEREPDIEGFDEVLAMLNINFIHHKQIMKLTEYDTAHDNEYYGNYTDYGVKTLSYRAVYDKLVEQGYISAN